MKCFLLVLTIVKIIAIYFQGLKNCLNYLKLKEHKELHKLLDFKNYKSLET